MRFVIRLKDGESSASLCRELGISRKTGYKIFERFELWGLEGLSDRTRAEGTPLSPGLAPNDLWSTDYKGESQLGDKRYCYPLTVTDHASRYLLLCGAMESNAERPAFTAFERLFQERGLPTAIRSANGVPFASPNGPFHLSKLSV